MRIFRSAFDFSALIFLFTHPFIFLQTVHRSHGAKDNLRWTSHAILLVFRQIHFLAQLILFNHSKRPNLNNSYPKVYFQCTVSNVNVTNEKFAIQSWDRFKISVGLTALPKESSLLTSYPKLTKCSFTLVMPGLVVTKLNYLLPKEPSVEIPFTLRGIKSKVWFRDFEVGNSQITYHPCKQTCSLFSTLPDRWGA